MALDYRAMGSDEIEFVSVAEEGELGNGERLFFDIDEYQIVLFNVAGKFFAIGDVCSHDDGPLGDGEVEGQEVICPRHGARFSIVNGAAKTLPAVEDIPAYPVRVEKGEIQIGIPKKA